MTLLIMVIAAMAIVGLSRTVRLGSMDFMNRPPAITRYPWTLGLSHVLIWVALAQTVLHGYLAWSWKGLFLFPLATCLVLIPLAFLTARLALSVRSIILNPVVSGFLFSVILAVITLVVLCKHIAPHLLPIDRLWALAEGVHFGLASGIMKISFCIFLLVLAIGGWLVLDFLKYKKQESRNKEAIEKHLMNGKNLGEAIETEFSGLNQSLQLNFDVATIRSISGKIASLDKKMDADNVIEIYSAFVHMYVFRNGTLSKPSKLDKNKILYAVENLSLDEKDGYFVIKPDSPEEFDRKYS